MRVTKLLREYRRAVSRSGAEVVSLAMNGHYHFKVRAGGKTRLFIASASPSDGRATKNFERDIRRWVRGVNE